VAAHRQQLSFDLLEGDRLILRQRRLDGVVFGLLAEVAVDVTVDRAADRVDHVRAVGLVIIGLLDQHRELPGDLLELLEVFSQMWPSVGNLSELIRRRWRSLIGHR